MSGLQRRLRQLSMACSLTGFNPAILVRNVKGLPGYLADLRRYRRMQQAGNFPVRLANLRPILHEGSEGAGVFKGHYFHQDLWAARKIFERRPAAHLDIGSRIDGFIAHLLVFMPVQLVDIRPIDSTMDSVTFIQDDATDLRRFPDDSVDSLSSLHAAEHFGLGRYSDPVDPGACFRFMNALQRVLKPGGRLYFSTPVGKERVEFNAQRVFAIETILKTFSELTLVSFSYVGDDGRLYENRSPQGAMGQSYACGLFEYTKLDTGRESVAKEEYPQ